MLGKWLGKPAPEGLGEGKENKQGGRARKAKGSPIPTDGAKQEVVEKPWMLPTRKRKRGIEIVGAGQTRDEEIASEGPGDETRAAVKPDPDAVSDAEADGDTNLVGDAESAGLKSGLEAVLPDFSPEEVPEETRGGLYLDAFTLALDTVLEDEAHLFDERERGVFEAWRGMGRGARCLYVRLFLRKHAWHRTSSLSYAEVPDLDAALAELHAERTLPAPAAAEPELESFPDVDAPPPLSSPFSFAIPSTHITTLEEAISLLHLDELKVLARSAKVSGKNKTELIANLRRARKGQRSVHAMLSRHSSTTSTSSTSTTPPPPNPTPTEPDSPLLHLTLSLTGPLTRLSPSPHTLFNRIFLLHHRSPTPSPTALTSIILSRSHKRTYVPVTPSRVPLFPSRPALLAFEAALRLESRADALLSGAPTEAACHEVVALADGILPEWMCLVLTPPSIPTSPYMQRYTAAHVYTRILTLATRALARLHSYSSEHTLLSTLLSQHSFCPHRRGAWAARKALLEERHLGLGDPGARATWKREAAMTCRTALAEGVGVVWGGEIGRRLGRLEKALGVPRVERWPAPPAGAGYTKAEVVGVQLVPAKPAAGTRTVWVDGDTGEGCTVEHMVLSHYVAQGWRGAHCEAGLPRTLFAVLLWDALFAPVEGVWASEFQMGPLDLAAEGFYEARKEVVEACLERVGRGEGERVVRSVWARYGECEPVVVGLDWGVGEEEVCALVRCFPPAGLVVMLRVLAEEYARCAGMPDLLLWHVEKQEVRFVEVKSENDRLSEGQRVWGAVLAQAGVQVEVCRAVAGEVRVLEE
ncbi:hypothetical protein EJ06DRAFT_579902 [Trichodelitschia bisporula]|uniref:Fanconi-associated nuclease n=1 Tax=Trichodelitschia bisporula TaxID=703511 RepID=A0A6G1I6R8_9PEZI|nr:hypothetical protein EJ06DRAFT_579902 [Trichodelitschia bisporula]